MSSPIRFQSRTLVTSERERVSEVTELRKEILYFPFLKPLMKFKVTEV